MQNHEREHVMATNKELEQQVKVLSERVARVQASNSEMRDEVVYLKRNYANLVDDMNARLEAIHTTFRNKTK